jgi:FMN-dependent oxidoreductase (nitrilotriacetate monooxygenase family)
MFHLGWFTNMRPHGWGSSGPAEWAGGDLRPEIWQDGSFMLDMARALDRACFDFIMLEDHQANEPKPGIEPRIDPLLMLPLISSVTTGLGAIATMSTSFYSPYVVSRLMLSADHLSHGRTGWNVVTTSEDYAAQATGTGDAQPPHDQRYARADEFVDLVTRLWDGWEADAITSEPGNATYVDLAKLHPVDFDGQFFRSTNGILNVSRSPQGRPIISQAGSSPAGREFAARYADVILTTTDGADTVEAMKDFRDDIRSRMVAIGRNPDDCKILYLVTPIIGRTEQEARERFDAEFAATDERLTAALTELSNHTNYDLMRYDFDGPFPDIDMSEVNGHKGSMANFIERSEGRTLTIRQTFARFKVSSLDLFGTAATVADRMEEVMDGVGGDGFLIISAPLTRRYIAEITDGLVPELQRRGLVRSHWDHTTLRENLAAF